MPNCNFDNGKDRWQPFTEDGSAIFDVLQGGGGCHAPLCPAAYIVTENYFVGGIYQQVPVVKGNTYYANVVWLVFDSFVNDKSVYDQVGGIGRKLGIDPFGGADPRSPNIVWGAENTRNDCKICANQEVTATAQADTITLFLRIDDRWRQRAADKGYSIPPSKDQFWIDDFGMKQVAGSAAPAAPPPSDTAPPPTDTPIPEPPTATPAPATEEPQEEAPATVELAQLADAPTDLAQAESPEAESVLPSATPARVNVIAPPPTLTPSATPSPTATFEPREHPSPTATRTRRSTPELAAAGLSSVGLLGVAGTTVCIGGAALLLLGAVLSGLVWLYRLGWGKVDDDEPDNDSEEEIIIEIEEDP
ncbi:MAG: hypothetical protein HYR94_01895 [Chloroflexi bacterium]|nr:hypothetical protein [Chloroflexota bacterium]